MGGNGAPPTDEELRATQEAFERTVLHPEREEYDEAPPWIDQPDQHGLQDPVHNNFTDYIQGIIQHRRNVRAAATPQREYPQRNHPIRLTPMVRQPPEPPRQGERPVEYSRLQRRS